MQAGHLKLPSAVVCVCVCVCKQQQQQQQPVFQQSVVVHPYGSVIVSRTHRSRALRNALAKT